MIVAKTKAPAFTSLAFNTVTAIHKATIAKKLGLVSLKKREEQVLRLTIFMIVYYSLALLQCR
jgi:hypothetical protein